MTRQPLARDLDELEAPAEVLDTCLDLAVEPRSTPPSPVGAPDQAAALAAWRARSPDLGALAVEPPPFPVEYLPGWLADATRAAAEATATRPDIFGALALGVASAAAVYGERGMVFKCRWGPMVEPLNLYVMAVEESGAGKSPAWSLAVAPLRELERELVEADAPARARRASEREAAIADVEALSHTVKAEAKARATGKPWKGPTSDELQERLERAKERLDALPAATPPRLLASDATPEALGALMATNPVVCLSTAEGDEILAMATGRYGKQAVLEPLLRGYDGEPYTIDRRSREPLRVEQPCIVIAGTTQPVTIANLSRRDGDVGPRGLAGRFLWAWPHTIVGHRQPPTSGRRFPADVAQRYAKGIRRLFRAHPEAGADGEPKPIDLSPRAAELADDFYLTTEARLADGGDLEPCRSMGSKTRSALVRLAGLLHLAEGHPPSSPVGAETATRAIELARYFLGMGVRVWAHMADGEETPAAYLWRVIKANAKNFPDAANPFAESQNGAPPVDSAIVRTDLRGLTMRDVFEKVKRRVDGMSGLRAALRPLVDAGAIFILERDRPGPGRKPSPWVIVHPEALAP